MSERMSQDAELVREAAAYVCDSAQKDREQVASDLEALASRLAAEVPLPEAPYAAVQRGDGVWQTLGPGGPWGSKTELDAQFNAKRMNQAWGLARWATIPRSAHDAAIAALKEENERLRAGKIPAPRGLQATDDIPHGDGYGGDD